MPLFDVAIIEMGPVGSAACILFAYAGLKVVAFERDKDVYALPRAVSMDGEVVRGFQRIGREKELADLLQPTQAGERFGFTNSKCEYLFGQGRSSFVVNVWPTLSMFDQPEVDGYLRSTASEHPNVTAHIGAEVERFEDHQDHVAISAGDTSAEARYLLGCDGAGSMVRRDIGVVWVDLGYDHDWLVGDVAM